MISRKSILGYVLASLFILTLPIIPSQAQGAEVSVEPPFIADTSLGPGTSFTIAIIATNVENLWGWQLCLEWDPNIITPMFPIVSPPFTTMWPSYVGVGEACISWSLPLGFQTGLYGDWLLVRLYFVVKAYGSSFIDLRDVLLVNPDGSPCPITSVTDGFFTNVEPKYRVETQRTYAEHRDWVESADWDNTLTTKVRNFGTVVTEANVVFTFTDEAGTWSYSEEIAIVLKSKQKLAVTLNVTRSWLLLHGAPPPIYGTYYVTVKVMYHDLELDLWLTGRLVKTLSFTLSP